MQNFRTNALDQKYSAKKKDLKKSPYIYIEWTNNQKTAEPSLNMKPVNGIRTPSTGLRIMDYGIYISPNDHEDYLWFRHNKTMVLKLLPILEKVQEIRVPFDQRDDRSQATKP